MRGLGPGGRTRLAPTPSGLLHAGNAINFLITQRISRARGSSVLLRIDDLDAARVRPSYIIDIFESLHWLGITWDHGPTSPEELGEGWSQRQRLGRYRELLEALRDRDAVYGCTCTRSRLRQASMAGPSPCRCRDRRLPLDAPDTVWRLPTEGVNVLVPALLGEERRVDLGQVMPDPVIRQRDGTPAYQVASLSDDVQFGITFLVRGVDLLPSTACQLHLADLLGLGSFLRVRTVHHGLIRDAEGRKLSKSEGAGSLRAMRLEGRSPEALRSVADDLLRSLL